MNNHLKKGLEALGLTLAMAASLAMPGRAKAAEAVDLNSYLMEITEPNANPQTGAVSRAQAINRAFANEHNLEGYMSYTLSSGRTVKLYVAPHTTLRAYITAIAVPGGADTYAFLEEQGWFAQADALGEILFVM